MQEEIMLHKLTVSGVTVHEAPMLKMMGTQCEEEDKGFMYAEGGRGDLRKHDLIGLTQLEFDRHNYRCSNDQHGELTCFL